MSKKEVRKWPTIKETTDKHERSEGVRKFEIEDARSSWEIKAVKRRSGITFTISGYDLFIFLLDNNGIVSGKKESVERVSDSGILSSKNGRFNLVNNDGFRQTIRVSNLAEYIPMCFNEKL